MKPRYFFFRVRSEQVLWYGWLQLEQVMGVMSRLIVLVHSRHTGPGFTSTSPALKRRDGGAGRGVHLRLLKKGRWEWRGFVVCAFHSTAWSMGRLGSNAAICRHLVGHHVMVQPLSKCFFYGTIIS